MMNSTMALTTRIVPTPSIPLTEDFFKTVENNISRTDELIPWEVALPIGAYTIVAGSTRAGEVSVQFVIKAGQRSIVDLDLAEQETYIRHFQPSDRMASSGDS
jgi:hypothetical protein